MRDGLKDEATYWKEAFQSYKTATGRDATCAWDVMCYFADWEAQRKENPPLHQQILGVALW